MGRSLCFFAVGLLALAGGGLSLAQVPRNQAVFLGKGMSSWRIGMPLRTDENLIRFERHPGNDGSGCTAPPVLSSRIDYYPGIRVSWGFYDGETALEEVATTRKGDRSAVGFVIGRSRLRHVRVRYPNASIHRKNLGKYALGRIELVVFQRTGYESGKYLGYWFNARGQLVAIATGVTGC
jgi:hypothetical protein